MINVSSVKIALESKGKQRDCLPFLYELIPLFNTNMSFSYKKILKQHVILFFKQNVVFFNKTVNTQLIVIAIVYFYCVH